jgi:murein DD-endopeptidase MepM/ murein hydrolase activator NlpD
MFLLALAIAGSASVIPQPAQAAPGFGAPLPLPLQVVRGFTPLAQVWDPGNRGVDLSAYAGEPVYAAAAGVVLYSGELAGRGVISIRHQAAGLRTTYEPVDPVVIAGEVVVAGELIGYVADTADACGPPGSCLHWGAINATGYLDPMSLLQTAVVRLLPMWSGGLFGELGP